MQREYLFRGKRRDNGEWAYGLIQYTSAGDYGRICGWMGDDGGETYQEVEVIPETIGQYTGTKDREEKMIFEGDILDGHSDGLVKVIWSEYNCGFDCIFSDEGNIGLAEMVSWFGSRAKIVGSIHNNPELIKPYP